MADNLENAADLTSRKKSYIGGMSAGLFLFLGAPLAGMLFSIYGTKSSFDAVEGGAIAPEDKAKYLANGISESMNALAIGGGVSALGLILLVVCLVLFLKSRSASGHT